MEHECLHSGRLLGRCAELRYWAPWGRYLVQQRFLDGMMFDQWERGRKLVRWNHMDMTSIIIDAWINSIFAWLSFTSNNIIIDWLIDWFIDWLIDWLIDWHGWMDGWMDWLIDWLLIEWLIDWLNDWLIAWLIDWLIELKAANARFISPAFSYFRIHAWMAIMLMMTQSLSLRSLSMVISVMAVTQSLSRMIPMMLHRMTVISMTIAIPPAAVAVTEESDVAWTCTSRSNDARSITWHAQWFMIHFEVYSKYLCYKLVYFQYPSINYLSNYSFGVQ